MAHSIYFIRDALFFSVFEHAVSRADAGRLIRVLKYWALSFRGVGQHNYARECVEVLIRWKYELTPKLRNALEKSWFVNRWGKYGRWIAADLYLEQLNYWVKVQGLPVYATSVDISDGLFSGFLSHKVMVSPLNTSSRKALRALKPSGKFPTWWQISLVIPTVPDVPRRSSLPKT